MYVCMYIYTEMISEIGGQPDSRHKELATIRQFSWVKIEVGRLIQHDVETIEQPLTVEAAKRGIRAHPIPIRMYIHTRYRTRHPSTSNTYTYIHTRQRTDMHTYSFSGGR